MRARQKNKDAGTDKACRDFYHRKENVLQIYIYIDAYMRLHTGIIDPVLIVKNMLLAQYENNRKQSVYNFYGIVVLADGNVVSSEHLQW